MANEKKTSRKKFRVAVSGSTVDGREISPVHLREAAENFNPDVYAARVNVEHYLSPCPSSEFSAMGDVTALSTEDITEGPLAGRTALYAEIEPTERMKQLVADGKKIYSSIELHPQFSVNGRAYLVGLAMTDTPASLGTERLKFTAQQRQAVMTFNSVQGEAPLISEAIESEIIEMAEQRQEEGTQWFNRVMGIIGRGRKADARISAGAFWPDIVLRELRLAVRLPGRVTTSRLLHTATGAVAHVTRELEAWQQEQQAAGHQTLADVPAPVINGESVNLWHWRNAVYTATRALILERYRDADTTDKGDRRADALDIQTSDLWRDVSWAISDILRRPRIFAELC